MPDTPSPKYKVGDWIRFFCQTLLISEVVYIKKQEHFPWDWEYVTNDGTIPEDQIFEVRPQI